jgi:hypothetical protein
MLRVNLIKRGPMSYRCVGYIEVTEMEWVNLLEEVEERLTTVAQLMQRPFMREAKQCR